MFLPRNTFLTSSNESLTSIKRPQGTMGYEILSMEDETENYS